MRADKSARRRSGGRTALGAILLAALLPGNALAAQPLIEVGPAKTLGSKPIVVSWHTDRAPRAGRRYAVELRLDGLGSSCVSRAGAVIKPTWKKGATVTATLRPSRSKRKAWWCLGKGSVRVTSLYDYKTTSLARALLEVQNDPKSRTPIDPPGTPVRIDLLEGSAITIKVPGRPNRSAPLSGVVRGFLPGLFKPISDLRIDVMSSDVKVGQPPPDPVCLSNKRPYPSAFDFSGTLTLLASSPATLQILPLEDPLAVAGCQGPVPPAPRPFGLVGTVGPAGLTRLVLVGAVGDLRMSDGVDAVVSVTLVVKIDLSGQL